MTLVYQMEDHNSIRYRQHSIDDGRTEDDIDHIEMRIRQKISKEIVDIDIVSGRRNQRQQKTEKTKSKWDDAKIENNQTKDREDEIKRIVMLIYHFVCRLLLSFFFLSNHIKIKIKNDNFHIIPMIHTFIHYHRHHPLLLFSIATTTTSISQIMQKKQNHRVESTTSHKNTSWKTTTFKINKNYMCNSMISLSLPF